jgi:hypothetical protein
MHDVIKKVRARGFYAAIDVSATKTKHATVEFEIYTNIIENTSIDHKVGKRIISLNSILSL